jgi:lipoyl(octanoyl) transferase
MWRLLRTPAARGAYNMALDEALMAYALETRSWILRVYTWSAPTLSLGRNQRARGGYDMELLAERGIDVVRRPTGGRAILHHREFTYSVAGPVDHAGDLRESYARINRLLVAGLEVLGASAVHVAADADRRLRDQPGLLPCFHYPTLGEITLDGRKLVGSAQWRCDGALLQHGSILVDNDQIQLDSLLIEKGAPMPQPATLRDALGSAPTDREMADALFAAVRAEEDLCAVEIDGEASRHIVERAKALQGHYLDDGWTWRR